MITIIFFRKLKHKERWFRHTWSFCCFLKFNVLMTVTLLNDIVSLRPKNYILNHTLRQHCVTYHINVWKLLTALVKTQNNFWHFCITTEEALQYKYVWLKESKHYMICLIKSTLCLQIVWRLFLIPISFLCFALVKMKKLLQIFDLGDNDFYCLFNHQSNMKIKWRN